MESRFACVSDMPWDAASILEHPESASFETATAIVSALACEETAHDALTSLAALLLLAPGLAGHVPLSILDHYVNIKGCTVWEHLAILLLHSVRQPEVADWLRSRWSDDSHSAATSWLLRYVSDWFPEDLNSELLNSIAKQSDYGAASVMLLQRQQFRTQPPVYAPPQPEGPLSTLLAGPKRLLVVHNIVDGQGDEMVRLYALLQAFLDGFPHLEITLVTDRLYLYDHPRVQVIPISRTSDASQVIRKSWDGILNFFEPYVPANSYNVALQKLLTGQLSNAPPPFYLWARKMVNHFTFESVVIQGRDFAADWQINDRQLPLNYETTMRLIIALGLPLRLGENKACAGPLPAANPQPALAAAWEGLKIELASRCAGISRPLAIVNVFGGQNPMKGFQPGNFAHLAQILMRLVDDGYDLVLVPNGDGWGGPQQVEAVLGCLPEEARKHVVAAPLSDAENAPETMRRIKYFVSFSDLVVTIEGWMMHLAYALGKPYRVLMAPYSYPSEWHPHGRSARQGQWLPPVDRSVRGELALPGRLQQRKPPPVHYPEKALLKSAFELWAIAGDRKLGKRLGYWMESDDRDIRRWVVAARGKIDPVYFRSELLRALADRNREVRASAAMALLNSGEDLTEALSEQWQQVLQAYGLVGEFRFQDAAALGEPARKALQACLAGDESEVQRDAAIALESIK